MLPLYAVKKLLRMSCYLYACVFDRSLCRQRKQSSGRQFTCSQSQALTKFIIAFCCRVWKQSWPDARGEKRRWTANRKRSPLVRPALTLQCIVNAQTTPQHQRFRLAEWPANKSRPSLLQPFFSPRRRCLEFYIFSYIIPISFFLRLFFILSSLEVVFLIFPPNVGSFYTIIPYRGKQSREIKLR